MWAGSIRRWLMAVADIAAIDASRPGPYGPPPFGTGLSTLSTKVQELASVLR